ncbi:MAG: Asp-tRNA(Asn)/Glu-tRNA(Gln) amidotransferase subunit GatA [Oscillospiraceae bacterium]|nr:Asp-tRNA(Asn)/Glu-tRNA(Gln) amidotransferase subunit GatA [Oscillospiraceae bacterium]
MTALELAAEIRQKKVSVTQTADKCVSRAEQNEYNAYVPASVDREKVLENAAQIQSQIDAGEVKSPLAGVPVALKDNISAIGTAMTCCSKMLEGYVPVFNATVVDKLGSAGLLIVGKTNMDEFGIGCMGETSVYGAVRNPHDAARTAGGSSGGSAAAVAVGDVPLALGSDTGGSVRLPAAFCGVTAIKPTYGAVSRHGLSALASSLDQIGVIGGNVDDCAALLSVISGGDEFDATCTLAQPFEFTAQACEGLKIGIPTDYLDIADDDVKAAVLNAAETYKSAGATVEEFVMPYAKYAVPTYYILSCAEVSSNFAKFDGLKFGYRSPNANTLNDVYFMSRSEGFGEQVKRRIMFGSFVLSAEFYDTYFRQALKVRSLIRDSYKALFKQYDVVLTPTAPTVAPRLGESTDGVNHSDVFTVAPSLAGLPAITLPCGSGEGGMPVGLQLVGDTFADNALINAARLFQSRTAFHGKGAVS